MNYAFDVEIAKKVGVDCAVFYCNLSFWVNKNRDSNKNYHDGKYWTYNTIEDFCKIFPFWSSSQIRRITQKLLDTNLIIAGSFNDNPYNKTKWYSLSNPEIFDLSKSANRSDENDKCTFDENDKSTIHIINKDINSGDDSLRSSENIKKKENKPKKELSQFDLEFEEAFNQIWGDYRRYVQVYRKAYGSKQKAYKVVKKAMLELKKLNSWEDNYDMFEWFVDYINTKLNKQFTPNLENLPFDDFEDFAKE